MRLSTAFVILLLGAGAPRAAASGVQCSPETLRAGDVLVVTFALPHGPDIAIVSPSGEYWFVSHESSAALPEPSIPEARARELDRLEIDPATYRLRPFKNGKVEPELVFTELGRYEMRVSENLMTDDGTPYQRCVIHFGP